MASGVSAAAGVGHGQVHLRAGVGAGLHEGGIDALDFVGVIQFRPGAVFANIVVLR